MDIDSFSPGQESCRKAQPQLTDLLGMDAQQAPSGVAFLYGRLPVWQEPLCCDGRTEAVAFLYPAFDAGVVPAGPDGMC